MLDFLKIRKKTKIEKHLEKMSKLDAKETKKLQKAEAKKLKKARKLEKKDSINVKIVPNDRITGTNDRITGIMWSIEHTPTHYFINGYRFAMISYFSKDCSIKTLRNFATDTSPAIEDFRDYGNVEFNFGIEAAIADLLNRRIAVEY